MHRNAMWEPACTIEGEAKCWSPEEVEVALTRLFCGETESCGLEKAQVNAKPFRILTHRAVAPVEHQAEQPAAAPPPEAPQLAEVKLDESGVPEFNAWEEGCD